MTCVSFEDDICRIDFKNIFAKANLIRYDNYIHLDGLNIFTLKKNLAIPIKIMNIYSPIGIAFGF